MTVDFGFAANNLLWTTPSVLGWLLVALTGGYVLRGQVVVAAFFVGGAILQIVTLTASFLTDTLLMFLASTGTGGLSYAVLAPVYLAVDVVQSLMGSVAWAAVLGGVFLGRGSPRSVASTPAPT